MKSAKFYQLNPEYRMPEMLDCERCLICDLCYTCGECGCDEPDLLPRHVSHDRIAGAISENP